MALPFPFLLAVAQSKRFSQGKQTSVSLPPWPSHDCPCRSCSSPSLPTGKSIRCQSVLRVGMEVSGVISSNHHSRSIFLARGYPQSLGSYLVRFLSFADRTELLLMIGSFGSGESRLLFRGASAAADVAVLEVARKEL